MLCKCSTIELHAQFKRGSNDNFQISYQQILHYMHKNNYIKTEEANENMNKYKYPWDEETDGHTQMNKWTNDCSPHVCPRIM